MSIVGEEDFRLQIFFYPNVCLNSSYTMFIRESLTLILEKIYFNS